jgi:hypothetical protein
MTQSNKKEEDQQNKKVEHRHQGRKLQSTANDSSKTKNSSHIWIACVFVGSGLQQQTNAVVIAFVNGIHQCSVAILRKNNGRVLVQHCTKGWCEKKFRKELSKKCD